MRSPVSVITACALRSIAFTGAPSLRHTPLPETPFGPAIGASWGIAFPMSTAFDSGGFSYGSCRSSLSKTTSAAASCCLAASAAATPAGPPPTTTILRTAFMRRLRSVRAARIIDTSATLRLDPAEQWSMERNEAHGLRLGAYSDGEKESSRQDRRARTARAAVLGRDRDSTAQGVLGGRGRNRHQRACAAPRAGEEHRPSARGHAGVGGLAGAESGERQVPARDRALPARRAGAPAHERLQRSAALPLRSAREDQRERASRDPRRDRDHVRLQSRGHPCDPHALRYRRAQARLLHGRRTGDPRLSAE